MFSRMMPTLAPVIVFLLLIVWQIPQTIALRNALLAILFIASLIVALNKGSRIKWLPLLCQPYVICLCALTVWLVLGALFWAQEPGLSRRELIGQWVIPLLCALSGALLAIGGSPNQGKINNQWSQIVFWALFLQVSLHDLLDIVYWIQTGTIPYRQAPVLYWSEISHALWSGRSITEGFTGDSGDKFSYVNNTLAALVVAELVQRTTLKKRWLDIGWPALLFSLVTVLVCTYFLQFRNGNVGLLLLFAFAIFMVLTRKARQWPLWKLIPITGLILALMTSLAVVLYRSDARWKTLAETVPIAWDTKAHTAWRKVAPYPELPNGQQVDASNYERLAWAKEGAVLILEHPLGSGYNRNAFGDGIDRKYEMNGAYRGGHSHSGLIDFGIANGIPGLLLWLSFLGALFYAGWVAFMRGQIAPALTLMFIVSGFLSRSVVDSNIRDHMLQQFMFLAMLFALSLPPSIKLEASRGD